MADERIPSAATPTLGDEAQAPQDRPATRWRPPGWGADLRREDRPADPKDRRPARAQGAHWDVPEQQTQTVPVLCSVERPGITPVFGSSQPPRGLSGWLRRRAFRFSENDLRHWLLLLFADRLNVGEGLVSDLASGRVPNVPAEMGIRAAWQHNPAGVVRKVGLAAGVLAVLYLASRRRRR